MSPLSFRSLAIGAVLVLAAAVGVVDGIIGIPDLSVRVERGPMAKAIDDRDVETFVLKNKKGIQLSVCSLGATITHLNVPGRSGKRDDIVLGHDTPAKYQADTNYFGAIVGRVANRIAGGKFEVDGKEYTIAKNDGGVHSLHGGKIGFDKQIWESKILRSGVEFTLRSADGDEGYPGAVVAAVRYILKDDSLSVEMTARSDKATPINLAQHSYFNLAGHDSGTVLGHEVELSADAYTELKNSVCTGTLLPSASTPFDFSTSAVVGKKMVELAAEVGIALSYDEEEQVLLVEPNKTKMTATDEGGPASGTILGFDHNYVLRESSSWLAKIPLLRRLVALKKVAAVREKKSGRVMEVASDAPGVQFYSGNFINACKGKGGSVYQQHGGLCLETQHFPNSIGADPATPFGKGACPILRPGSAYRHTVRYTFKVEG
mmetsp:Transcript_44470/g.105391  ORF Transcript_44470/g.105391 Transcript_44470/m.105391 type:complete len:432 (+) Transcript_44470:145-1440(+)|eukprot:CAMPEP_0177715570 /NCGR_PEP_ID=MMETSP0484_2-20121128/14065_1 /TAXON_ID=354590 /ORGANISM="Rhodomonas lens, Strain RHODO" /LENGTH=431 /DNA_ID=CAMNT_0019227579 /DNA_START=141 /DNA_END=1436 /DNA_ORIENTATION=-